MAASPPTILVVDDSDTIRSLIVLNQSQPDSGRTSPRRSALLRFIAYLQGAQVAVVGSDVEGTEDTLDASFKFRYGAISKG